VEILLLPSNLIVCSVAIFVNTRYLMAFMTEKGNAAAAYKLLGQIQEMQKQPALDAYKRSLDLDSSQNDVLLKGIFKSVMLGLIVTGY